jgi:hypothetical protein
MNKNFLRCIRVLVPAAALLVAVACGDDDEGGTPADQLGVGATCDSNDDCLNDPEHGIVQECLTQFKGGYCGLEGCVGNADCPSGSACVTHDDGKNYCFRICVDKAECNQNRTPDTAANCSSNIDFVDGQAGWKACVPPSSG